MYVFRGVFTRHPGDSNDDFDSVHYIERQKDQFIRLSESIPSVKNTNFYYTFTHSFLPLYSRIGKQLNVVDFGGGFGTRYLWTDIDRSVKIEIIDREALIAVAVELNYQFQANIKFGSAVTLPTIDVLHLGSVLQYFNGLDEILSAVRKEPQYIFISDGYIGTAITFYSYEHWYGKRLIVKFYSNSDFFAMARKCGYQLISSVPHPSLLSGKTFYNMTNFPAELILARPVDIILERTL